MRKRGERERGKREREGGGERGRGGGHGGEKAWLHTVLHKGGRGVGG